MYYYYFCRKQKQQQALMLFLLLLSLFCSQHGQSSSLLLFGVRTTSSRAVVVSTGWFKKKKDLAAASSEAASSILTTLTGIRAGSYNSNAAGDLLGDDDDDDDDDNEKEEEDYSLPPHRPYIQFSARPSQQQQESPLQDSPKSAVPSPPPRRALILMDAFCDYHGLHLADRILHDDESSNDDDDETAVIFVLSDYLRGFLLKTQPERAAMWQAMRMPRFDTTSLNNNSTDATIIPQQQQAEEEDDSLVLVLQQWTKGLEIVGVYCESDSGLHNAEELRRLLNVTHQDDPPILPARRDKYLMNQRIANMTNLPVARQQLCTTTQQARDFCIQQLGMSSSTASASSSSSSSTDESSPSSKIPTPCRRVVVKPCRGVASEDVRLCQSIQQVEAAFDAILGTPIFGSSGRHEAVLVQEYLIGCEYAVDVVCRHGDYKVAAVWRYDKRPNIKNNSNDDGNGNNVTTILADFCYFKTELVDATMDPNVDAVCAYVKTALQALGIRQGLSHTEVIVTNDGRGPVLVEVNCRQHNMDFIPLTMICIGYNALDMTLTSLLGTREEWDSFPGMAKLQRDTDDGGDDDGDDHGPRHGCMVHLVNSNTGTLKRVQYMEEMSKLPSFLNGQVYPHFLEIGSKISPTIDIKSDAGWVQLVHEDADQLEKDYKQILEWMPTMFDVDES